MQRSSNSDTVSEIYERGGIGGLRSLLGLWISHRRFRFSIRALIVEHSSLYRRSSESNGLLPLLPGKRLVAGSTNARHPSRNEILGPIHSPLTSTQEPAIISDPHEPPVKQQGTAQGENGGREKSTRRGEAADSVVGRGLRKANRPREKSKGTPFWCGRI